MLSQPRKEKTGSSVALGSGIFRATGRTRGAIFSSSFFRAIVDFTRTV